jgi:hypothetical protein
MSRSHALHLPLVMQRSGDSGDFGLRCCKEMKAAEYFLNVVIQRSRGLHNFLDARMRTSNNQHQTLGCSNGK